MSAVPNHMCINMVDKYRLATCSIDAVIYGPLTELIMYALSWNFYEPAYTYITKI